MNNYKNLAFCEICGKAVDKNELEEYRGQLMCDDCITYFIDNDYYDDMQSLAEEENDDTDQKTL